MMSWDPQMMGGQGGLPQAMMDPSMMGSGYMGMQGSQFMMPPMMYNGMDQFQQQPILQQQQ